MTLFRTTVMPKSSSAAVSLSEFVSRRVGPSISDPMAMMAAVSKDIRGSYRIVLPSRTSQSGASTMAACNACGTTILFGGATVGEARYCNARCAQRGQLITISRQIAPDVVTSAVSRVFHGACPKCNGPGPVELHTSYRVYSVLIMTSWQSFPEISCRSCGVKAKLGNA